MAQITIQGFGQVAFTGDHTEIAVVQPYDAEHPERGGYLFLQGGRRIEFSDNADTVWQALRDLSAQ